MIPSKEGSPFPQLPLGQPGIGHPGKQCEQGIRMLRTTAEQPGKIAKERGGLLA